MSHQKKNNRQQKKHKVYLCPYCGNEVPYVIKRDTPFRCGYCKQVFSKHERIRDEV